MLMAKRLVNGVAMVGRATAFCVGLAVVLAVVLGIASSALAADGKPFVLGRGNVATKVSTLFNKGVGPALGLKVGADQAPLRVNPEAGTATNLSADELDGKDSTDFAAAGAFRAAEVVDASFPNAKFGGTYTSRGGTLVISASGSAFRSSSHAIGPGKIGVEVKVDGQVRGKMIGYANERDSHKALVDDFMVVEGLPPGPHEIRLWTMYEHGKCWGSNTETPDTFCTHLDSNDHFRVSVMELPNTN